MAKTFSPDGDDFELEDGDLEFDITEDDEREIDALLNGEIEEEDDFLEDDEEDLIYEEDEEYPESLDDDFYTDDSDDTDW